MADEQPDTNETEATTPAPEGAAKPKRARRKKAVEPGARSAAKAKAAEAEAEADEAKAAEAEADEGKDAETGPAEPEADAAKDEAPATPAAPAPARRRRGPEPSGRPPVVRAQARYVRSSARKARLVCDHLRGKSVDEARAILAHANRAVARDWSKLLESAVANAEHNHDLDGDELRVLAVHADEGPTLKRFRPRAMGRATRIRKRTSHLTITLTPKE